MIVHDRNSQVGLHKSQLCTLPFTIFALLALCLLANGNPIGLRDVYINSEHLEVNISPDYAEFTGTFTFGLAHGDGDHSRVFLPIWLPEPAAEDARYSALPSSVQAADASPATKQLAKVLGLRVLVGNHNESHERFWEGLPFLVGQASPEPRLRVVSFEFFLPPRIYTNSTPVTISYHQPCLRSKADGRFFYLPLFESLPQGISTADTNRYSITITAQRACTLAVTNGAEVYTLRSGQSLVCSPKAFQPIRARAWCDSNPSVQRTQASSHPQSVKK